MGCSLVAVRSIHISAVVMVWGLAAALPVHAQQAPETQSSSSVAEPLLFPRLMVSLGLGTAGNDEDGSTGTPLETLSVQFLATRHVVVEGDIAHWSNQWDRPRPGYSRTSRGQVIGFTGDFVDHGARTSWSTGANVLFRTEPRRVSVYVGGGPLLAFVQERSTYGTVGCSASPGFEYFCQGQGVHDTSTSRREFGLRAVAGADVSLANRVRAYGDLQFATLEDAYIRLTAGVRVEALKQSAVKSSQARVKTLSQYGTGYALGAPAATGKTVRVTFIGGQRFEGTLLTLSTTEVAIRRHGKEWHYPLDQILIVETAHHRARAGAIIGAIGGIGLILAVAGEGGDNALPEVRAMFAALGAAVGSSIGLGMDRTLSEFHVLYLSPPP